jgi:hypothetical protein
MSTHVEKEEILIVMDYNSLPSEYKLDTVKESIEKYKEDFNIEAVIVPIDISRKNIEGSMVLKPKIHRL